MSMRRRYFLWDVNSWRAHPRNDEFRCLINDGLIFDNIPELVERALQDNMHPSEYDLRVLVNVESEFPTETEEQELEKYWKICATFK